MIVAVIGNLVAVFNCVSDQGSRRPTSEVTKKRIDTWKKETVSDLRSGVTIDEESGFRIVPPQNIKEIFKVFAWTVL